MSITAERKTELIHTHARSEGDAQTPEEKVERIIGFVHDFVRPSLSATMPTACS